MEKNSNPYQRLEFLFVFQLIITHFLQLSTHLDALSHLLSKMLNFLIYFQF